METKEINEKLDKLNELLEQERKSFKEELEKTTSKTKSEFVEEQKKLQAEIDRLTSELEDVAKKQARVGEQTGKPADEYAKAFGLYLRKGMEDDVLKKAMDATSGTNGGYLVSENLDKDIGTYLYNNSVMRQNAMVLQVPSKNWAKNFADRGNFALSSWVGETAARPATDNPDIIRITGTYGEIYSAPQVSQALLDEADWNVEQFLAEEIGMNWANTEEEAFWTGDGVNKPKGLLAATTSNADDSTRVLGQLQFIEGNLSADILTDIVASLRTGYLSNAKFYMNRSTLAAVRKLAYADNSPVVRITEGGFQLHGFDIVTADALPNIATGTFPIAFGDMKQTYTILDVARPVTIRDPYTAKPYVSFYTTKTVGSAICDTYAMKLFKSL